MTPIAILFTYLSIVVLHTAISIMLDLLNLRSVRAHSKSVPSYFATAYDDATYARSVAYTIDKMRLSMAEGAASGVLVALAAITGFFGAIDTTLAAWELPTKMHGLLCFLLVSLIFGMLSLPFRLYGTFYIENRYGFNRTTPRQWLTDLAKGSILNILLITPLLLGLLWFMESAGAWWWLYAFAFVGAFQLALFYIFPVFIAPLFNTFTPLADGTLREALYSLANGVGFHTSGIFVMDGSKRSNHANAYFTGFGKHRRIVLFDTLLESLSAPQTVAVLAHEIGHAKLRHIQRMLFCSLLLMGLGFLALDLMLNSLSLFEAFGFKRPSHHAALILVTFAASPLMFFISPLMSLLSRSHEYQADAFAARAMGESSSMTTALLALSKRSLSNLTPHPWYSAFHYSHPTLHERLQALSKISFVSGSTSN